MTITAAADGSALGNPGPAGWAWYVDDNCWRAGGWPHGTNNQGELMAVLDLFRATAHKPDEQLHILCDSQYVINAVTKWMPGWKRKGWRKADGKPVLNVELLKDIDRALVGRKYTFEWVRGHAGHDLNEAADDRARAAATAYQQRAAVATGPGFGPAVAAGSQASASDGEVASLGAPGPRDAPGPRGAPGLSEAPGLRDNLRDSPRYSADLRSAPSLFGEPDPFDEPDLFSELAEQNEAAAAAVAPQTVVEDLERELLRPETRADMGRMGVLLHPDFVEIGGSGRIWTRDAVMTTLEEDPGGLTELEVLGADRVGADAVLLTYRSYTRSGTSLCSSLWVLDGTQWRLRFHQGTPEI